MFKSAVMSPFFSVFEYPEFCQISADYALSTANVQKFLKQTDLKFDLVINEEFFHDSFLMLSHKFKAPIITISKYIQRHIQMTSWHRNGFVRIKISWLLTHFPGTYGTSDFFDWRMGLLTPWSHVPHSMIDFSDHMTFTERLYNVALCTLDSVLVRHFLHLPNQMAVAQKHFKDLAPLPSLNSLSNQIAVTLVYTHRSISYPRPSMMPGLINIGGAHIKATKPLPNDIQRFLDEAIDGAIFFSLGTFVKSSRMPKDHLTAFLSEFG